MRKYKLEIYTNSKIDVKNIMRLIDEYALKNNKKYSKIDGEFGHVVVEHIHTEIVDVERRV